MPHPRRCRSVPISAAFPVVLALLAGCDPDGKAEESGVDPTPPPGVVATEGLCQMTAQCYGSILDDPKTPCTLSITDGEGAVAYDGPAGFELRGRSSLTFPKPQYAVELRQYTELPVWPGSTWSYLDDGTDLGTAWREAAYDDSSWSAGPGQLGYGEDFLQTAVSPDRGPDGLSATTYFRHEFSVISPELVTKVELGILRDDGAAVYLNGVEVQRDNLPPDATYDTWATEVSTFEESITWRTIDADPALIVAGTNVLAVEVHQAELSPDDLRFDLYLEATGEDQPTDLLGMGGAEDWIVNGQYVDRSLFRNRLAYDLFQAFGGPDRYATETRFCELDLNGEYVGVYTLGEKLEQDGDRLDLAEGTSPGDTFIVKLDDRDGFHDNAVGYGTWQLVHPDPSPEAEAAVGATLAAWEAAILGDDPADPDTGIFAHLDLASTVDWVLLQELAKNPDAYRLSVHLFKDEGAKMKFAPWDLDLSMGYPYTDCGAVGWNPRDSVSGDFYEPGAIEDIDFIRAIAAVPAFKDALVTRWAELREGVLADDAVLGRIAGYDATLAGAVERNFAKWPIEDIAFSTDYPEVVENWLCPVSTPDEEHARTVAFLTERLAWMDANLASF
jgi:hypothetical protein